MEITYAFEGNQLDAIDPLGSITISEGESRLHAHAVFLDSFLTALLEAYARSSTEVNAIVEIPEERESIRIERQTHGLNIQYADEEVFVISTTEFESALRVMCVELLKSFPDKAIQNDSFDSLRRFISSDLAKDE